MSFWAYMLHCRGGYFYTGHTEDLEARIAQHESGMLPGFASDHAPVKLVWSHEFETRYEALAAERQIKGWSRSKKLALIHRKNPTMADLMTCGESMPADSEIPRVATAPLGMTSERK